MSCDNMEIYQTHGKFNSNNAISNDGLPLFPADLCLKISSVSARLDQLALPYLINFVHTNSKYKLQAVMRSQSRN